jgi:hypothetical protein
MAMKERELGEREFGNLIGSDKVEGTAVYGPDESKIGSIERVMIDKISGRVSYAVLGFGGFLGLGNDHYPLPGNPSNTTNGSAATAPASPRTSCAARLDTAAIATGTGATPPATARSTIITAWCRPDGSPTKGQRRPGSRPLF